MNTPTRLDGLRPYLGAAVLAVLGGTVGALAGGLRGLQAGWIAGLLLSVLPLAVSHFSKWIRRRDTLVRFVLREVADVVVARSGSILEATARALAPIKGALRWPSLLVRLSFGMFIALLVDWISGAAGALLTPLGIANLVAVAIIVGEFLNLGFAPFVSLAGLLAMILILLVSESERRDDNAAPTPPTRRLGA